MDLEVRRDVVHHRITGTCQEGLTDAMARILDRPTARRNGVHFLRHPDGETPPPRRFAARRDVVHRRTTGACLADLTDAMARCLDRPTVRRHPVHFLRRPEGETSPPRRFAARRDVVHRRTTGACPADLTDAMGTKDCIARGYERRGFVEVDTGDKLSWTVPLTERPKVGIGGE